MGTWGVGNFDNDTAADHLSILVARLVAEVRDAMAGDPVELEPDEYHGVTVPCTVEVLTLLRRQGWVGVTLPERAEVQAWKARYLEVWDHAVDDLEPTPEFRAERRSVLERTFDDLADLT